MRTRPFAGHRSIVLSTLVLCLFAAAPGSAAPFNGRLVFDSERDGDFDIYTMNSDGFGVSQLTLNGATDRFPNWTRNGNLIAFSSDRDGDNEIFTMTVAGTNQTQLTFNNTDDDHPVWNPAGTKLAFHSNRDGDYEIFTMNPDGSGQTQLTFNSVEDHSPNWSPDGTKLAFIHGNGTGAEVWVMDANGTNQLQLTNDSVQEADVSWAPDGSKLLFRKQLPLGSGWGEFFTMNPNGTGEQNVTNTPSTYEGWAVYSPDGAKIAVMSNEDDPNFDIYVMNANGTGRTRITTTSGQDGEMDWQYLFYVPALAAPGVCGLVLLLVSAGALGLWRRTRAKIIV